MAADPVGRQLQRARESKGLSVTAVAEQQHLRSSIIQAIEAGDYSKIDTELFLKGYVRAYARQVDLDGDALIRDLDAELAPMRRLKEEEQQAHPLVNIERRRKKKRQVAKVLLLALVLGLAGYLAFQFFAQKDDAGAPAEPATHSEQPALEQDTVDEAPAPDVSEAEGSMEPPAAEPINEVPSDTDIALPDSDTAQPDAIDVPDEAQAASDTGALPEDSSRVVESAQVPADVLEPALTEPEVTQAATPSTARLEMTFSDDCWIQVSDSTGRRLVSALRRQGDSLDVSGVPPLRVVVGAMNAVESIQFQGEPLAMDSFRVVNNRSEFTLEP